MDGTTVNQQLAVSVDAMCDRIGKARGAERYREFTRSAWALKRANAGERETLIIGLQALCWAAMAAGVKETTVRGEYTRIVER